MTKFSHGLVLLRRDLRLEDHYALEQAKKMCTTVSVAFCFDPKQCDPKNNKYFSQNAFLFLTESLSTLSEQMKQKNGILHIFHEKPTNLIKRLPIDALFVSSDVTPIFACFMYYFYTPLTPF